MLLPTCPCAGRSYPVILESTSRDQGQSTDSKRLAKIGCERYKDGRADALWSNLLGLEGVGLVSGVRVEGAQERGGLLGGQR